MRAKRVDDNHGAVVAALRKAGCVVQSLATVGRGCPDLLVLRGGKTTLLEVKDGSKPPSARRLTADEVRWAGMAASAGVDVYVVSCPADALLAVGVTG